jgi:hypothetical protein
MIEYLRHGEIDRERWDRCVAGASFETIYPYSWYLDLVSPEWEGLVMGDYEMIMPLTPVRKFGLHFLLQPVLAQQLGVFSLDAPNEYEIEDFLRAIPPRFLATDICLNGHNMKIPAGIRHSFRVNHELDLRDFATSYSTNARRNLQKGREHSFEFREIGMGQYLDLKYSDEGNIRVGRDYLERLFGGLSERNRAVAYGLFLDGALHAGAVLGYAGTRVIYMNGSSGPEGKESRAMFVLMDRLINLSREKFTLFDFEGSNLPGVARFFEGFGAFGNSYPRIQMSRIPFFRLR